MCVCVRVSLQKRNSAISFRKYLSIKSCSLIHFEKTVFSFSLKIGIGNPRSKSNPRLRATSHLSTPPFESFLERSAGYFFGDIPCHITCEASSGSQSTSDEEELVVERFRLLLHHLRDPGMGNFGREDVTASPKRGDGADKHIADFLHFFNMSGIVIGEPKNTADNTVSGSDPDFCAQDSQTVSSYRTRFKRSTFFHHH